MSGRRLALTSVLALAGCKSGGSPPVATAPFVFPASMPEVLDAPCREPAARLRDQRGTEDDGSMMVACLMARLPPGDVDAFVQSAQPFFDSIPQVNPRRLCAPGQKNRGHFALTQALLENEMRERNLRLSPAAIALIAGGAEDPDFFEATRMAAHGQTESSPAGVPTQSKEDAELAWRGFVRLHVAQASDACARGDARLALYHVGYALHAVQDVASHRGRTQAELAYDAGREHDPDRQLASLARATEMSVRFLTFVFEGTPVARCRMELDAFAGLPLFFQEKTTELGLRLERTPSAIVAEKAAGEAFRARAGDESARVRWFGGLGEPSSGTCADEDACRGLLDRLLGSLGAP